MPKNIKGGKGAKKQKNHNSNDNDKIIFKDGDDQDYGKVEKLLGNCRVQLICNDKEKRLGIIRGSMRKKVWINLNSVVLYCKRQYEDDKVDIIVNTKKAPGDKCPVCWKIRTNKCSREFCGLHKNA